MSLIRIATRNMFEEATSVVGVADPSYPLSRLSDRNIARQMRGASVITVTGGTITTDGAYTVHRFTGNGTLNVSAGAVAATVLVVGGGGGGSRGGGGAGGLLTGAESLVGAMPVYVGGGGAGGVAGTTKGTNGGNSSFGSRLVGGGGGGATANGVDPQDGEDGGSGGGGASSGATTVGGSAFPGQGNDGGGNAGYVATPYPAGGGGGAGAVGGDATSATAAGAGGAGINSSITGASVGYAGGGGGGVWADGTPGTATHGGGAGNENNVGNGTAGTANTGGGGGGTGGGTRIGGAGGSGVVIVRYLTADLTAFSHDFQCSGDAIASVSVDALILAAGHNVGGLAYTLGKSSDGTTWTTVASGTLPAGTGQITIEFAATAAKYWKFSLPSGSAPILTELVLTHIYTFERAPARPSGALENEYNVKAERTSAGSDRFITYGPPRRIREYSFPNLSAAMADDITALVNPLGMAKPFFMCDHTGAWIFGNITEPLAPAEITAGRRSMDFKFAEVL